MAGKLCLFYRLFQISSEKVNTMKLPLLWASWWINSWVTVDFFLLYKSPELNRTYLSTYGKFSNGFSNLFSTINCIAFGSKQKKHLVIFTQACVLSEMCEEYHIINHELTINKSKRRGHQLIDFRIDGRQFAHKKYAQIMWCHRR